ncbi:MAG: hypothetical protein AAGE52_06070 [Myxococcota bacterium]
MDSSARDTGGEDSGEDGATPLDSGADAGSTTGVWRPFTPDSPWNTPIAVSATVHPESAALIAGLRDSAPGMGIFVNIPQFSVPVYWVDGSTPLVEVVGAVTNIGMPGTFMAPVPTGAMAAGGDDRHLSVARRDTGDAWDMIGARFEGGRWRADLASTSDLNGSGVRPPKNGEQEWFVSHGARACGYPLLAGLIRVEEMEAGRIEHALVLGYPGIRSRFYTPPASTAQATFPLISPDAGMPCGARVQLDPSVDVESLGLSPAGVVVARALQEYGAFVGDFSGAITIYADAHPDAQAAFSAGLLSPAEIFERRDLFDSMRVLQWGELFDDMN